MLTSIRIQNFRSIRDASVKLGQVNLFIGPNNSGKSNFLKGIEFLSKLLDKNSITPELLSSTYRDNLFKKLLTQGFFDEEEAIRYSLQVQFGSAENIRNASLEISLFNKSEFFDPEVFSVNEKITESPEGLADAQVINIATRKVSKPIIYKADPAKFQAGAPITNELVVSNDGANLVSFLFNLSQNHKAKFRQLENDLAVCVGDIVSISTPADPTETGKLRLKFFDKDDISYWADEVSEGVLYFLVLLCIIHQPNPPTFLLIEEPEKGIHPRRIREVIDFIFELARLRNIQIIITSHSPYIVDHFADIPECISVFDRIEGKTIIHNAADIIRKINEEYAAQGLPPTKYTDSLGEYWLSGFLGGVPL